MDLSLIIPTIGRSSLQRAIDSVTPQLGVNDEIIVVVDGHEAWNIPEDPKATYIKLPRRFGDYGCTPCDYGISIAKGDMILLLGDDDLSAPTAFQTIKSKVTDVTIPHLFAMIHTGRLLSNTLGIGHVSGQQLVFPNNKRKIPKMGQKIANLSISDWEFIMSVYANWDSKIEMHPEIIAYLEIQNLGKFF